MINIFIFSMTSFNYLKKDLLGSYLDTLRATFLAFPLPEKAGSQLTVDQYATKTVNGKEGQDIHGQPYRLAGVQGDTLYPVDLKEEESKGDLALLKDF